MLGKSGFQRRGHRGHRGLPWLSSVTSVTSAFQSLLKSERQRLDFFREDERFEEERFDEDFFDDDLRDDVRFDVDFFDDDFFFDADFLRGTFAPLARASERPIAIACLRLFTLPPLPPRPLRS